MLFFPFDSLVSDDGEGNLTYDRAFNSANLRKIFHGLYTNGVAMSDNSGALQVIPYSGMQCTVKSGFAIIEGAMGIQESDLVVVVDAAHTTYTRIDSIMVRLNTNLTGRCITIEYVKGAETSAPSAPAVVRSGGIYDLRLANIRIPAGATSITGSMITDTRLGSECGIATARPQKVDTTAIYAQYQASLAEYMQYVQDCISGTVAGNLDSRLSSAEELLANTEELDSRLSSVESLLASINTSLTSINSQLTELLLARNITSGFYFDNAYWLIDSVYCIGKLVFIKGRLASSWAPNDSAKYSGVLNTGTDVHLTIPAGYNPITPAPLLFGATTGTQSNRIDKIRFQLNPEILETYQDGSTKHLLYGFARYMYGYNHFQIIYMRAGSVV